MKELHKNKLIAFANDQDQMDAVYEVLLNFFLKKRSGEDINLKGGRFIATEELQEAWKDFENYKVNNKKEEKASGNIGL